MGAPAWRFDAVSQGFEERFGYRRDLWPEAARSTGLRPGMRVLDVGCGAGSFTRFVLQALGGRGEVVGLDHDEALLARAREATPEAGEAAGRVRFVHGRGDALPFPDGHFDAVVSGFLLCVVPDPLRLLREMRRVTRPGGTVASVSCFCKSGLFPSFGGLGGFEGAERLEELRERFRETRRVRVRNPALGLPDGRDLDVWGDYARAGLEDLRIRGVLTVFAPDDARWSDEEAREMVEGRWRIERDMLSGMTEAQVDTLARHGFSREDLDELRDLVDRKYRHILDDPAGFRGGMDLYCEPAVLIVGRVPGG